MVNPKNLNLCSLGMGFPKIESLGILPVFFLPEKSKYADFFTFNLSLLAEIQAPIFAARFPSVKIEFRCYHG